ncbi:hypothetical protein [Agromyces mariniharenae]|nr:hypothetical protein [Agromyces mariniharenae]
MADPVGDIIGDDRAFTARQRDRLLARWIPQRIVTATGPNPRPR